MPQRYYVYFLVNKKTIQIKELLYLINKQNTVESVTMII